MLTIRDHGLGMPPEKLDYLRQLLAGEENSTVHTGLYNIHRRIQLIYGSAYGLTVACEPERGTCIQMRIPFRQKGAEDAETDHR